MATTQIKLYGKLAQSLLNKEVSIVSGSTNLYAMLTTSAHAPDQDVHRYKSDITNEAVGSGYTAGGVQLTGVTVSYDAATNKVTIAANSPSWPSSSITARNVHIYDRTNGTDATRALIAYGVFDADQTTSSGNLQVNWNSGGVFTLSTP